jgi:hypothetical protein
VKHDHRAWRGDRNLTTSRSDLKLGHDSLRENRR